MKNDFVTVLDFGSSKITCMAAVRLSYSGEFIIKAVGQASYSGFDDKTFYEPDKLESAISLAISQVETKLDCKVRDIFVGVPGAFCASATSEASTTFHSRKKIEADDVTEIVNKANIHDGTDELSPLSGKPVYFLVDDTIKTYDPVGVIANKLTGLVNFSFMKKYFRNTVAPILLNIGIGEVYYVNTCEAQANFINNAMFNEGYSIIIDIGHITTNVSLCGGRGLLFQRTFALGSGYFASDLSQITMCDFNFAMAALEKVNLNLEVKAGDAYAVNGRMVEASQTNAVVKARICQIADYIVKSFQLCDKDIPIDTPVILTGGGLAYLRGGVDVLAQQLGKRVQLYTNVNPQTNRNEYTSTYGLLFEAVRTNKTKRGFLAFIRNLFKGDK
ncbi:MAG: hypothetical protein J1F65_00225 [Clostridiales bacterium]|nr:hypothetical protein [Clostridiales bacterium]